jgi:hypothetical protein
MCRLIENFVSPAKGIGLVTFRERIVRCSLKGCGVVVENDVVSARVQ